METDYSLLLLLISYSTQPIDVLKDLCENFLNKYCDKEGLVKYGELIRLIADKEKIEIELT